MQVRIVNAFVDGEQGGNPAGVVLQADALSAAQKQAIAAQVGLSETAFVSSSQSAAFKLEFFTPTRQIAHCGHATVATFSLLRQLGLVSEGWSSKETIDGNRDILLRGDMAFMEQRQPQYLDLRSEPEALAEVLASLGKTPEQLLPGLWPTRVNTGASFVIVPLRNEAQVAAIVPDQAELARLSEQFELIGFYVFSQQTRQPGRDAGARMFAPRYGIDEESATGMAAGPLACFLHDYLGVAGPSLLIEQGYLMQLPSASMITVDLQLAEGRIERLLAGGKAQVISELTLEL
ncbi:MAG: PhzF family phenazine biosynthesis protein [Gammaproteobacteria bacterium]|nr:PhzF family phenazine biosynthesis protein [Gammaproteobacteria bacterium]MBU2156743.1 PhzF family phenazine biosynthesis protein [Gammaproteobacteria bacterium]MBU2254852.1 PhzF family phenazine biosynthesis protein [Gammaproteobacteria bacterium]MBU2295936.1 PhzF family phenazine biosynthesis protein [Gammaproteobacteria bacterium]